MDDDPVLRSLGAQLEHDDPRLAALLSGTGPVHRHTRAWWLLPPLLVALVVAGTVRFGPQVLGAASMLLAMAAPLAVGLWFLHDGDAG